MRLPFGFEISLRKAAPPGSRAVDSNRGWVSLWSSGNWSADGDRETGSWQRDERMSDDSILAQATVFSCITLIASDWSKLGLRAVQRYGRVWLEKSTPGITDLLEQPNHFQTRQQFIESWALSKLSRGNTYVLKVRDRLRDRPKKLIVLNPDLVTPLVAPNGDVFYQLGGDDPLAGITDATIAVPASEIIHDRFNCLFHPLVGLSPIFASGLAATQSLRIQQNSARFFKNMARPGGMLTAPAKISDETAARLKTAFEKNFAGENIGRLFVAGDGLVYSGIADNAVDSQVVEQLKWSATTVAATFHIPPYMVGAAEPPALNNIEAEQQRYYNQCLQSLIEASESCLDRGLDLMEPVDGNTIRTDFNVDDLLRMDSKSLADVEGAKVQRGISTINESRAKFNNLPVDGGDTPFLQEQNWPVKLLAERNPDGLNSAKPTPAPPAPATPPADAAKAIAIAARAEIEEGGRTVVAEIRDQAAGALKDAGEEAGRAVQTAATAVVQQLDALADGQQQAAEWHAQAARDAAAALQTTTTAAAEQLTAAAGRAADEIRVQSDAGGAVVTAIAAAAEAATAGTKDAAAAAAKEATDQLRAAGESAQAAIEQATQRAVDGIAEQARAALAPLVASLTEAAAAQKAAEADDDAEFEDFAARLALALETADA